MSESPLPPDLHQVAIDAERPLLIVDCDEVLGQFMRGFEHFVVEHGLEMRIDRFALFQNIYRPGASEPIDMETGKRLFDAYFACDPARMEMAPGASDALAELSDLASVVVLTNAPATCRAARARWLAENGMPYPMLISSGPKGRPVAALSARTQGVTAFVDDLLHNLDSVEREAPHVHRFQSVADLRLRPHAPSRPDRHARHDDWPDLAAAIAAVLRDGR